MEKSNNIVFSRTNLAHMLQREWNKEMQDEAILLLAILMSMLLALLLIAYEIAVCVPTSDFYGNIACHERKFLSGFFILLPLVAGFLSEAVVGACFKILNRIAKSAWLEKMAANASNVLITGNTACLVSKAGKQPLFGNYAKVPETLHSFKECDLPPGREHTLVNVYADLRIDKEMLPTIALLKHCQNENVDIIQYLVMEIDQSITEFCLKNEWFSCPNEVGLLDLAYMLRRHIKKGLGHKTAVERGFTEDKDASFVHVIQCTIEVNGEKHTTKWDTLPM